MIEFIKDKYQNLDKEKQLRVKQVIIATAVVAIIVIAYFNRQDEIQVNTKKQNTSAVETIDITTDAELFEDDILDTINQENEKTENKIAELKKNNDALTELVKLQMLQDESATNIDMNGADFPQAPNDYQNNQQNSLPEDFAPQWVGGIVHEEFDRKDEVIIKDKESEKKRIIKLPPSFMQGFLLTGMDAMTIEGANDTPEPMMIRVQAPAVLPNEVRANLKGCFVIAEGYGNLATHRVDAKLVSLSCIDYAGGSVIFEKIKGYVQDSDGKRGIKGKPVHRAGALVARSMIAGAFKGIGGALTNSAQTTNISALGQTTSSDTGNGSLVKSAIGGGISAGAKDVRNLFLQLAKQSSPVIEVGAAKKISVVITNLVELHLKEL